VAEYEYDYCDRSDQMMDELDALIVRGFKLLVALALIAAGFWGVLSWVVPPPPPPRPAIEFTEAERRYVAARMKFHGITSARFDPATGERWFEREGKRCKL
jgi:hypothetical protein